MQKITISGFLFANRLHWQSEFQALLLTARTYT